MPDWVSQGFQTYQQRMSGPLTIQLTEIPLTKRRNPMDIKRMVGEEGKLMRQHIKTGSFVIALDVKGQAWSTARLVDEFTTIRDQGRSMTLLIGGPEGLAPDCLAVADKKWSLSALTLAHPLVRLVLIEAIYRAWSITIGHPYHR